MLMTNLLSSKPVRHTLGHKLILLACGALLSACAMSPQTVVVKPDLRAPSMPIGHGRSVKVETHDRRSDPTLGTLGGVYKSAYLTTDERMEQTITQEAVTVLQSWDFVAVPSGLGRADMPTFKVEILDINYQRPATSVGGNVVVKCKVAVKVDKGTETYSGEYISQRSEQVAVMGTAEGNRKLVNQTIGQALNQIFLDSKLQRFMAR
jgi:uncharacterized lipoprotein YajG